MDELINFIIGWAGDNGYSFIVPNNKHDEDVDFITINVKTKTIYFGELDVTKPLTEVG